VWDEFTPTELCAVLAGSKGDASGLLGLAHDLEVKLPGTKAAFLDGILSEEKVAIIARATAVLNAAEARAAEALVLDRAGRLTPGALRAAIARAVMEVAPDKARQRREQAARDARVERWAEDSGNAALMGRELPPDEVLAADQRITAWARELKKAGLEGDMDELRARAYLDLLLDKDSRPPARNAADPVDPAAGPPGGYGTWILRIPGPGPDLIVTLDPISTEPCDHRYQARGHDPGVKLRHLSQIRYATCTGIACRRPSTHADFEHNTPYEAGGRTCLCNGDAGGLFATRCGWSVILVVVRASVPVRSRFSRLRPQNRVRDVDACGAVAGAGSGGRGGDPGEVRGPAGAAGGGGAGPAGAVDGR